MVWFSSSYFCSSSVRLVIFIIVVNNIYYICCNWFSHSLFLSLVYICMYSPECHNSWRAHLLLKFYIISCWICVKFLFFLAVVFACSFYGYMSLRDFIIESKPISMYLSDVCFKKEILLCPWFFLFAILASLLNHIIDLILNLTDFI